MIDQSKKVVAGAPFSEGADSALWADAQAKADTLAKDGKVTAERAAELKELARKALLENVAPGYAKVIAFGEEELPKAAENASGVGATHPNGKAYYEYQLKQNTTTAMTAEEIHQLGLSEVARLRGELEALQKKMGVQGDLQAFFEHVRNDPARVYPNTDAGRQALHRPRPPPISPTSRPTCRSTSACCPRPTWWSSAWKRSASSPAPPSTTTRARLTARARACTTRTCRT